MFVGDENKNARNKSKHGMTFDAVHVFDWETAVIVDRSRHADEEQRFAAIGMLDGKLHTVIFTHRADDIRIISLRRSNKGEERTYAQKT
jgi:uncharacterized DUF497 family protein